MTALGFYCFQSWMILDKLVDMMSQQNSEFSQTSVLPFSDVAADKITIKTNKKIPSKKNLLDLNLRFLHVKKRVLLK